EDRKDRALARAAQGRQVRPARGGRRRAREVRARARRRGRARATRAFGAVPRRAREVVRLPAVLPRLGHLPREGRAAEEVLVVSVAAPGGARGGASARRRGLACWRRSAGGVRLARRYGDRKSTRLNSSHVKISYA